MTHPRLDEPTRNAVERILCGFALAALAACAATPAPRPASPQAPAPVRHPTRAEADASRDDLELVAIDSFGTSQVTRQALLDALGDELRRYGEAAMRSDRSYDPTALFAAIRGLGDFAYVEPALVGYFEPDGTKYYLTIDFVDRDDADRRMAFSPDPTGDYPDPAGLLAAWDEYNAKTMELIRSREMSPQRVDCPALHCLGNSAHPQVKAYLERFAAEVPAHVDELQTILRDDHADRKRGAAAYLLAYAPDRPAAIKAILAAFADSSAYVRNNAMRVIADVATYHPTLDVPLEPVLTALSYPATTDRNKAAAILDGLLARPDADEHRDEVATRAGATLVAMLRLQQPNNHDFAYRILKTISGQDFGERNYEAWEAWLAAR